MSYRNNDIKFWETKPRAMQSAHTISRASLVSKSKSITPAGSIHSSVAVHKSQKSQRTVATPAKLESANASKRDRKSEEDEKVCKLNNSASKPDETKQIEWYHNLKPVKLQK